MIDLHPAGTLLSTLIEEVPERDLGNPSPCREYSVGDLLDHIAGITVAFGDAAAKADGASSNMGPQGDAANLDPQWRTSLPLHLDTLTRAWSDPQAWTGMTRVGGRDLPADVAGVVTYGELTVHAWDLAQATGLPFAPDPGGLKPLFDIVSQTFGPGNDASRGSAFGPAIPVADDAPMFDQILGLLGRDPGWSSGARFGQDD